MKTYRKFTAEGFWENAKPSRQTLETKPEWMTFDDQWVDEVRQGLKACTVFCWYPIYCKYGVPRRDQIQADALIHRAHIQSAK